MNKHILVAVLLFFYSNLTAQHKYDQQWIVGFADNSLDPDFGGNLIDFNYTPPRISYVDIPFRLMFTNSQICNVAGELEFYTNGCYIEGFPAYSMVNGDSINPGEIHDDDCRQSDVNSYKGYQSVMTLPWPGRSDYYALFHLRMGKIPVTGDYYVDKLFMTEVDMTLNGDDGGVVTKNKMIHTGDFTQNIAAVRHANGRDWWLLTTKDSTNIQYIHLFDPSGVRLVYTQEIGSISTPFRDVVKFSEDGSKFIRINQKYGITIYEFDRCAGKLLSYKNIPYPIPFVPPSMRYSGASFSPNSRYLYVSTIDKVFQYDVQSNDIAGSKIKLIEWVPEDGIGSGYLTQMLGPDGKIYLTAANGNKYFHVIHSPDSAGLACNFEKFGLPLLTYNSHGLPHHPSFRTAALPTFCDSSMVISPSDTSCNTKTGMVFSPNPVNDKTVLSLTSGYLNGDKVKVYSSTGALVAELPITPMVNSTELDCSSLPAGIYFISMDLPTCRKKVVGKLVKVGR